MSKQNQSQDDPFVDQSSKSPDAPITTSQLLDLFAKMAAAQNQSSQSLAETLAKAIVDAQKPYIDPKKAENDEMFREQSRRQRKAQMEAIKASQASCPHIAGCNSLSEFPDPHNRTCIVWHQNDATEIIGICTNCQRIFRETDPDYMEWRKKASINRLSKGGERQWSNAFAAKKIARGDDVA